MSDNLQFKEINRQKLQAILEQENRMAVNLEKNKTIANPDFYSIERTMEDNRFISEVLSDAEADKLQLTKEQKADLLSKQSRNYAHILVNKQKFTGDSGLMRKVKENVIKIENLLREGTDSNIILENIQQAYVDAIKACENYCANKNPYFPTGKARKNIVEERLAILKKEQVMLRNALAAVNSNEIQKPNTILELLEMGYAMEEAKNSAQNPFTEENNVDITEEQKDWEIKEGSSEIAEEEKLEKTYTYDQREIEEANKIIQEEKEALLQKANELEERIKNRLMSGNDDLKDKLRYFGDYVIYSTHIDESRGVKDFVYSDKVREKWKSCNKQLHYGDAKDYDGMRELVKMVYNHPESDYHRKFAEKTLKKMDEDYSKAANNCPIIPPNELEVLLQNLSSKSHQEQRDAVIALQNYHAALMKWDVNSVSMPERKFRQDNSDVKLICKNLEKILEQHKKMNPRIY